MKQMFFLLFAAIFFALTLEAQELNNHYLSTTLSPGYPAEAPSKIKKMNFPQIKSASFETGVDSIKVLFGSFMQDEKELYFAALNSNENFIFQMFNLKKSDSSKPPQQDVEFKLNNSTIKISVRVMHDPATDEVFYYWINKNGSSKIALIEKIDRPIQENKPMPNFSIETLKGTKLELDDFKGKYLVINWWATTCAPCIAEMPGLNEMVERYKSKNDVRFIAIARDDKSKLEDFLTKRDFKYEQTLFTKEVIPIFGNSYPKHIIVNPKGVVTYYAEGGSAEAHLNIEKSLKIQLENN